MSLILESKLSLNSVAYRPWVICVCVCVHTCLQCWGKLLLKYDNIALLTYNKYFVTSEKIYIVNNVYMKV